MACFLAPTAAAAVVTTFGKKVAPKYHIEWLLSMLWGGVLMLIVEHISHGEIVPYFPFFTKGLSEMMPEILEVGVPMVLAVTLVWAASLVISGAINKKQNKLSRI